MRRLRRLLPLRARPGGAARRRAVLGDDRGSAAIEAAIGVPAFMLFVGLIIFAGRSTLAHQGVEQAAYEAARAASIARDPALAQSAATQAATSSLATQDLHCTATGVAVDTTALSARLGAYGTVTVQVTCEVDLSDLVVPGVPGSRVITASMSSPVDAHRERP